MRITNSMLVNNLMRNLNQNLNRLDKYNNQLATGRKYAHISDDPVALIYGQAARNKLARLNHYQRTVGSAQDWLRQVETGARDLQERIADIYTEVVGASTDVNNISDKNNIAELVKQLRDHYLDTLNTSFGDKFVYAGYNTPGNSLSGPITGPFQFKDGLFTYNGYDMTALLQIDSINLTSGKIANLNFEIYDMLQTLERTDPGLAAAPAALGLPPVIDTTRIDDLNDKIADVLSKISALDPNIHPGLIDPAEPDYDPIYNVKAEDLRGELNVLQGQLADINGKVDSLKEKWDKRDELIKELTSIEVNYPLESTAPALSIVSADYVLAYDAATGKVNVTLGYTDIEGNGQTKKIVNDSVNGLTNKIMHEPDRLEYSEFTAMLDVLRKDVLSFDVGPGVSMDVTFNGIDLVLFKTVADDGQPVIRNIFTLLDDVYAMASDPSTRASELGVFIRELQDAQNHLLTKVAEIGGRTRRLELLEVRYGMDEIGYEQMKSDAEDVDAAEVIMYLKMAEAVYQAALSSGARIIQPTLMDFLR